MVEELRLSDPARAIRRAMHSGTALLVTIRNDVASTDLYPESTASIHVAKVFHSPWERSSNGCAVSRTECLSCSSTIVESELRTAMSSSVSTPMHEPASF